MDETIATGSSRKKKELVVHGNVCWFCKKDGDEDSWHNLGKLHKTKDVKIEGLPILYHEPCAAYCSGMGEIPAPGMDEKEIEKWYKYGERASNVGLKCAVCGLRGATAGCCMKQCSKTFHYTCARIAAFQGQAYFSIASRNVSCDKHSKWLTKPIEEEFMGMWMEGLGGWHGGLNQQAHNSWLPHLGNKHTEFQNKWLTSSNYPLTLLSPKPAAKLPGPEGLEADALDTLASLCAERMDKPDPAAARSAGDLAGPGKDSSQTAREANGLMGSSGATQGAGQPIHSRPGDNAASSTRFTAGASGTTSAAGQRAAPTDPIPLGTFARNPSNQENVKPSSPFLDVQIPLHGESGTGTGFTQKVLGSNLQPGVNHFKHQQSSTMQNLKDSTTDAAAHHTTQTDLPTNFTNTDSTLPAAPASAGPPNNQQSLPTTSAPQQPASIEIHAPNSMAEPSTSLPQRVARRSLPVLEDEELSGSEPANETTEGGSNPLAQFTTPLDSLRMLARAAVPSPAVEDQQQLPDLDDMLEDVAAGSRMSRQRSVPPRFTDSISEGGDTAAKTATRKRPSSAALSSMLTSSADAGGLEGEESEQEEDASELGIYEPAKKKPRKTRLLTEVYTDPISDFVPSPPSRHPRPTPTPRLVKKRRTPSNSAAPSPSPMVLPSQLKTSERPSSRGKGSRGSTTPSGGLDKTLNTLYQTISQPLSQPASPVSILITPPGQAATSKKAEEVTITNTSSLLNTFEPLGLDLHVSLPQTVPSGLTGNIAMGADHATHPSEGLNLARTTSLTRDGIFDGGPDPEDYSPPSSSELPLSAGRSKPQVHPTSSLRERCKPLQIDTSAPTMCGSVEPAPAASTSMSPTNTEQRARVRMRIARKDTGSSGATYPATNTAPASKPQIPVPEEDLIDVGDGHLLGSAPHTRMPSAWPAGQSSYSQGSPGIVITQAQPQPGAQMQLPGTARRQGSLNSGLRTTASGSLGPQSLPHQDESQLTGSDQYGDEPDLKFEDHEGLDVGDDGGQLGMSQHVPARMGRGPVMKEMPNPEQSVNKVNMLLNGIQQFWIPEGMSGPEIAALAAQQNPQAPIHLQPLMAQPTIFTSSNMGMNGAPAMFAPIAGMNPHALGLLPRLPYLPHKMMSFANGLTPTGRPSRSTRCAVCIIQKKGKCGTEQAPKNCLRRNQNILGIGNGFAHAPAGMHPIQFQMQHPAMLQMQGGQAIVASPLVSPLVSPLPSPLPSPSNQFGSILVQQQSMNGVSSAMLMQTPHGLQLAGGFSMNQRQGTQDRMMPPHGRGHNVRLSNMQGPHPTSNLSSAMLPDQVLDLGANGSSLRPMNAGNAVAGPGRREQMMNQQIQRGPPASSMMRGVPEDNFGMGGMNMNLSQSVQLMDSSGLEQGLDDFQGLGTEWVQDPNGFNLIAPRMSGNPQHMMHQHDMLQDDMDHGDVPGPESPFPRAQDRIQVFSGCVDMLPPLVTGEERVLGITMHPRYAARFHAHMRSEAGRNAPLVAVPHNTAVFLQQRKVNPEVVVESLRGLIQESLLDPEVQPRFGLPDDLPVRGVDRFIVPPTDPRLGVHGQWGLKTNEDVAAGTAIGAYGSYAMFREDHERFATNPPSSYRSVVQASSRAVLDAKWELLVESNAVSSTLPASLGAGALGPASRGLGEEEVVMCALGYGNLTALANDPIINPLSEGQGEKENTHVLMFMIHGWPLPIMVTLQNLPAHTEILYSYGQAYWDLISKCQQQLEELGP